MLPPTSLFGEVALNDLWSDSSQAMAGCHSSLVKYLQAVTPTAVWKHSVIHHQALAANEMSKELCEVLDEAVIIVNLIKSLATNAHPFPSSAMTWVLPFNAAVLRGLVAVPGQSPHLLV